MSPQAEMPRYECHKKVHALKIKGIELKADKEHGRTVQILLPADDGYAPFIIDGDWVKRALLAAHKDHDPAELRHLVGGYYVVYDGGYTSYSPAKAFEEGYTRI